MTDDPRRRLPQRRAPLPAGQEKTDSVRAMFDAIAPRYDIVNRLLTFGMDVRWRRRAVDALELDAGAVVVDLACGTGDLARELTGRDMVPVGVDLSLGMLTAAPEGFCRLQGDSTALPLGDASALAAVCGFALRNFTDLDATLSELARVVRPGGRIALLDVAEPPNRVTALGHRLYFNRVVPLVGGLLSDRDAYSYLPRSVAYLPPTDELLARVRAAGFAAITRTLLSAGIAQLIVARRGVQ